MAQDIIYELVMSHANDNVETDSERHGFNMCSSCMSHPRLTRRNDGKFVAQCILCNVSAVQDREVDAMVEWNRMNIRTESS